MSAGRTAVVTDSTAYLPEGLALTRGVGVVPLQVVFGSTSGDEGVDVLPAQVAAALTERRGTVTTSRPAPARFVEAYLATGAESIVSVHLSGRLSGTVDAALIAAQEVAARGITVRVVDSQTIAMGLGFAVLAAAQAAAEGADLATVEERAVSSAQRTKTYFYVDTLEFLRRGGRIGAAAALFGTALAVKPLLQVYEGQIAPLEKVRTVSKALARLEQLAVEQAGEATVDIAVHHLAAPERAEAMAARLRERVPGLGELTLSEVGAVVGAHVGPGLLGVVIAHR